MAGLPGIAQADRMPSQRLWPLGRHFVLGFYDLPSAPDQQQGHNGVDDLGVLLLYRGKSREPRVAQIRLPVPAQAETASSIKTDAPIGVPSLFQVGPVRPARRICKAR